MKVEWWYNDAVFHYSRESTLALARLTVADGGRSEILTDGGEVLTFEDETEAAIWLTDEEYRRLEDLLEDYREDGRPVDPRIKVPAAESGDGLLRQMVIDLRPASASPPANGAESLPAQGMSRAP